MCLVQVVCAEVMHEERPDVVAAERAPETRDLSIHSQRWGTQGTQGALKVLRALRALRGHSRYLGANGSTAAARKDLAERLEEDAVVRVGVKQDVLPRHMRHPPTDLQRSNLTSAPLARDATRRGKTRRDEACRRCRCRRPSLPERRTFRLIARPAKGVGHDR